MARLSYFFCMLLSFVVLCATFVNGQDNEESLTKNIIPADLRNALMALMKPFSENKSSEQIQNGDNVSDSEIIQTDLFQLSIACQLSALCPNSIDWLNALPFGILASKKIAKIAKPKVWKLGIALKVVFLKLIMLKKLVLIKTKLKIMKAKPFIIKSPLIVAPIIMSVVAANLGNQIESTDVMLRNGSHTIPSTPASFLGPFAQFPGVSEEIDFLSSLFSGFMNPVQSLQENPLMSMLTPAAQILPGLSSLNPALSSSNNPITALLNPVSLLSEGASIIPGENELSAFAQLFRNGLGDFTNLLSPNLRRLQSVPQITDITGFQQVARYVIADSMLDFVSIIQLDDATRRDYNEFVGYATEAKPELIKASLRDEVINTVKLPEAVMKIVDLEENYGQKESLSVTIKDIDEAIVEYARSVKNIQI